jgi:hypothetical protein
MALFEGKVDSKGREKYTVEEIRNDIKKLESHMSKLELRQLLNLKAKDSLRRFIILLLNKFFRKEGLYCIGSSIYDRVMNEVDILIFSEKRGDCVGSFFVEFGEPEGPTYEEKTKRVMERNQQGGAYVKYAFKIVKEEEKERVLPSSENNVPIYYIAMPDTLVYHSIITYALPGAEVMDLKDHPLLQKLLSQLSSEEATGNSIKRIRSGARDS